MSNSINYSASSSATASSNRRRTENRGYQCEVCGKVLSRCDNLKNHMRMHTGEKPFSCKYCGRKFKWPSGLRNHEDIHVVNMLRSREAQNSATRAEKEHGLLSKTKTLHPESKSKKNYSEDAHANKKKTRRSSSSHSSRSDSLTTSVLPLLMNDEPLPADKMDTIEEF